MKKLLILAFVFLNISLLTRPSFCQETTELTERELEIYREYREQLDVITDTVPEANKDEEINKMRDGLADKYNLTREELDDITGRGWLQEFWELYRDW